MHLESGLEVCARRGKVAYASQAWEFFELSDNRPEVGDPVLVYASHSEDPHPVVTWQASYLGYVR